jgi:hypothetical protein
MYHIVILNALLFRVLQVSAKHHGAMTSAREVLRRSLGRPPVLFCYGAHEWAMVSEPLGVLVCSTESIHCMASTPMQHRGVV